MMNKYYILLFIFPLLFSTGLTKSSFTSESYDDDGQMNDIAMKLGLGDKRVLNTSIEMARDVPGEFSINQVGAIYNHLVQGWSYLSDPSFQESYKSSSLTLDDGIKAGTIGAGDCDDFAILIASLIEALGGSTRIIIAQDLAVVETQSGHAYTELYLGHRNDPQLEEFRKWISDEYGVSSIPGIINDSEEVWLNLDYNSSYLGGPFFGGEKVSRRVAWEEGKKTLPKIIPMIDTMDSLDAWQSENDEIGSKISLSLIPTKKKKAVNVSFDLAENGWVGIKRDLQPNVLKDLKGINLSYYLNARQVSLDISFRDENGTEFNRTKTIGMEKPGWNYLEVLFDDMQGLNPGKAKIMEFIIRCHPQKGDQSGEGCISLDQIKGVLKIPKDSPWAMVEIRRKEELAKDLLMGADSLKSQRGDQLPLSVLLSIEAAKIYPSWEANKSLYQGLALLPRPLACFHQIGLVYDSSFSPDGRYFATASCPGIAQLWDLTSGGSRIINDTSVELVLFSPDGKRLISAGYSGFIKVWSLPDLKEMAIVNATPNAVEDAVFSPDGRYLAYTDWNLIKILNASSYEMIQELDHMGRVASICFSPDSTHLAAAGEKSMRIWDVNSSRMIQSVDDSLSISSVSYSPDGRYLAIATGFTSRVWEVGGDSKDAMEFHHENIVNRAIFSPDSRLLATASCDNTVRIWDLRSRAELTRMVHGGCITAMEFSSNGEYITTGGWDNTVMIWDTKSWKGLTSADREIGAISGLYFSADGRLMATLGGTARLWDAKDDLWEIFRINDSSALNLALSSSGKYIGLTQLRGNLSIWDTSSRKKVLSGYQAGNFTLLKFSPDERYLITGDDKGIVKGWDIIGSSEAFEYSHDSPVLGASFDQKGDRLTTLSMDGNLKIFDLNSRSILKRYSYKREGDFALSRDGRYFARSYSKDLFKEFSNSSSAVEDICKIQTDVYCVEVINLTSNETILSACTNDSISYLAFSNDDSLIAGQVFDRAIVWRVLGGEMIAELPHKGIINHLAISYNGLYLAASESNGLIKIWAINSGKELLAIDNDMILLDLFFSPDDRYLICRSSDSKLRMYPLDSEMLVDEARYRMVRNLSKDEREKYLGDEDSGSQVKSTDFIQRRETLATWIDPQLLQEVRYNVAQIQSQPVLNASPVSVGPGEAIKVMYSGAPGNRGDWVSIYSIGDKSENFAESYYLGGNTSGELIFTAPSEEGLYHFRMFADWPAGGYNEIAISNNVQIAESLAANASLGKDTSSDINEPPRIISLQPDQFDPIEVGRRVIWTALAADADEDPIYYRFLLSSPARSGLWLDQTGWRADNSWTWETSDSNVGEALVQAQVIDGKHSLLDGWDDSINASYNISEPEDGAPDEERYDAAGRAL